jgi:hypothetical protein
MSVDLPRPGRQSHDSCYLYAAAVLFKVKQNHQKLLHILFCAGWAWPQAHALEDVG